MDVKTERSEKCTVVPLKDSEFATGLTLFRERTRLVQRIIDWFSQFVEESIIRTAERFNVLSVGSGSGHFDLPAMTTLMSKLNLLAYDVIEPNEILCQQFEHNFHELGIVNVILNTNQCFFEDFTTQKSYDLIHFTNSISLIPNHRKAIASAFEMLKPGGLLTVVHFTLDGYQDLRLQLSKEVKAYKNNVLLPEEIDADLHAIGAKFDYQLLRSEADVTDCFEKDSAVGEALFDFILGCNSKHLDEELRLQMLERIASICTCRNGRQYIAHSVGAHVIRKH